MILTEARIRAGQRRAFLVAGAAGLGAAALAAAAAAGRLAPPLTVALALGAALAVFAVVAFQTTSRWRRLARATLAPFPAGWEALLRRHVAYYRELDEARAERFRRAVALFLADKRITGIDVELDDQARVLVAASAVIPVFGLQEWAYRSVVEVLLYPESFDDEYEVRARRSDVLGMAPGQTSTIILSLPALVEGFGLHAGRMHVGIHEFLHAVDGEDGEVDGMPDLLLDPGTRAEWIRIVKERLALLEKGGTILDLYAGEDEAELFAVAGEHFFLDPAGLARGDPDLYAVMARILRQDPLAGTARAPRRRPARRRR